MTKYRIVWWYKHDAKNHVGPHTPPKGVDPLEPVCTRLLGPTSDPVEHEQIFWSAKNWWWEYEHAHRDSSIVMFGLTHPIHIPWKK